jgi:hypothetical protein
MAQVFGCALSLNPLLIAQSGVECFAYLTHQRP